MNRLFVFFVGALVLLSARAYGQGPDDLYVQIYNVMKEADALSQKGQPIQALAKYREAQSALQRFQRAYPEWNSTVVKFRLSYLESKVATVTGGAAPAEATAPGAAGQQTTASPERPARTAGSSGEADAQINNLKEQVRQLQGEKTILEAKLKEAFAARPSAVDPQEFAKAEERVKTLQKENDQLKASLDEAKGKQVPNVARSEAEIKNTAGEAKPDSAQKALSAQNNSKALQQAVQSLDEVKRKLAAQTDRANILAQEKAALQNRLNTLSSTRTNADALEQARTALKDSNRQLAEQKEANASLLLERDALQNRLRAAAPEGQALSSLRTENQMLKKQLADLKAPAQTASKNPGKVPPAKVQLGSAPSGAADALENQQRLALETRLKELSGETRTAPSSTTPISQETNPNRVDAARIKQLERERDELRSRLDAAIRKSSGRKAKDAAPRIEEMENQLSALRARLEVFEARQVPYSAEELALFKAPDPKLASAESSAKKSPRVLPAGAASLVLEAQRYFTDKRLDKAEEKYMQVLHQDDKNVYVLANLAAIQVELGHLDDAEKNISKAVGLASNDAYSLSILGYLRFQQQKYDEALDSLGRAAKLEPENAEIQNYLGLTLAQKGLRGPAETALRKALQIDPNYGSAHNNLAVIYLSQQPPATELARWHYQKALAGGHPRNPELEKMLDTRKLAEKSR